MGTDAQIVRPYKGLHVSLYYNVRFAQREGAAPRLLCLSVAPCVRFVCDPYLAGSATVTST